MRRKFNVNCSAAAAAMVFAAGLAGCGDGSAQYQAAVDSNYIQPSPDLMENGAGQPIDPRTGVVVPGATRPER